MATNSTTGRENFGSKFGIIMAAAGSAVGLGNVWKFPYITGQNGGGAFLMIYLACVLILGLSVMLSEFTIGRRGGGNVYRSFKTLAPNAPWFLVGIMGIVAAFFILAFYTSVAGWTLEYMLRSVDGTFDTQTKEQLGSSFSTFISDPFRPVLWQWVFILLTGLIVSGGISNGIEKYNKILMPMLFVFLIILIVQVLLLPNSSAGLTYLFAPDFSKVTGKTVLYAMGQAFFSLSLGMGTLVTYASYFGKKENLAGTALNVSMTDTIVAVMAGMIIFPAVFSFNIEPTSGPSLVFITLPEIFKQMPLGNIFGLVFFALLAIAALTSTVSLQEVIVAYFSEEFKMSRLKANILGSVGVVILGTLATLSFGELSSFKIFGKTIFDLLDFIASNLMLPLGGLFIVLFVGWFMKEKDVLDEISNGGTLKVGFYKIFRFTVKFIAPLGIAAILVYSLFFGSL